MRFMRFFGAGMIGGLAGAVAWAAVSYITNWELGLIAWLVGVLAGVTVRAVAGDDLGRSSGAAALIAALLCVGIGKLGTGYLYVRNFQGFALSEEEATSHLADIVMRERARAGAAVKWPAGVDPANAYFESDYPPDIWVQAAARWKQIPAADRDRFIRYPMLMDEEFIRHDLADTIVEEFRSGGRDITVVEEVPWGQYAHGPDRYPPDVWAETTARWDALSADERKAYEQAYIDEIDWYNSLGTPFATVIATIASISLWDLLWLGLAGVSAWKIGSGASGIMHS